MSTSSLNVEIGSTLDEDEDEVLSTEAAKREMKCKDIELNVNGFPVKIRPKFSKSVYIEQFRECSRLKRLSHIQQLEIEKQEVALLEENILLNKVAEDTKNLIKQFDKFLSLSYDEAFKVTQEAIEAAKESKSLAEEKLALEERVENLKAELISLEEKWNDCVKYQKFLFSLSPVWWRQANAVNERTDEIMPAILYFNDPRDIFKVFNRKTEQSLRLFSKSEQLASEMGFLKRELKMNKIERAQKQERLQKEANDLQNKIRLEEENVLKYKKLAIDLINGPFHEIVTDTKAIKLFVLIEDVYEAVISNNDTSLSMREMIKELEIYFSNLLIKLDSYPKEVVSKIENETIVKDKRAMKQAVEAARKIKESEMMIKNLKRAIMDDFDKALRSKSKPLMFRSVLPKVTKKVATKSLKLNKDEWEFLRFFSNYCRRCGDKPEDFLQCLPKFSKSK